MVEFLSETCTILRTIGNKPFCYFHDNSWGQYSLTTHQLLTSMRFYIAIHIILRKFIFCVIILFLSAIQHDMNLLRNFFYYAVRKPMRFYGLFTALKLFSQPWRKARKPYPYIHTSFAKYTKYFLNPLNNPRCVDQTSPTKGVSVILSPPHHCKEFLVFLSHLSYCRSNIFNALIFVDVFLWVWMVLQKCIIELTRLLECKHRKTQTLEMSFHFEQCCGH